MFNNWLPHRYLEIFIFPGITIIGIWMLLFSLSRINHWDDHAVIALASFGFVFLLFGIDLQSTNKPIIGFISSIVTATCILIYFFVSYAGTDLLAIIGTIGLSGIIGEILFSRYNANYPSLAHLDQIQVKNISSGSSGNYIISEDKEIDSQFESLKGVIQGFRIRDLEKIEKVNEVNHDYLLTILKTRDYLDKVLSKGDAPQAIKNLDLEINQFLEDRNIEEILVNIGDIFDPLVMKATVEPSNSVARIKKIIKKGYLIKSNQNEQIIRKPLVEVNEN